MPTGAATRPPWFRSGHPRGGQVHALGIQYRHVADGGGRLPPQGRLRALNVVGHQLVDHEDARHVAVSPLGWNAEVPIWLPHRPTGVEPRSARQRTPPGSPARSSRSTSPARAQPKEPPMWKSRYRPADPPRPHAPQRSRPLTKTLTKSTSVDHGSVGPDREVAGFAGCQHVLLPLHHDPDRDTTARPDLHAEGRRRHVETDALLAVVDGETHTREFGREHRVEPEHVVADLQAGVA